MGISPRDRRALTLKRLTAWRMVSTEQEYLPVLLVVTRELETGLDVGLVAPQPVDTTALSRMLEDVLQKLREGQVLEG